MHSTVDDHRRHYCRHLKKEAGSPSSVRRARSDSCIRQCGQSTTARMCLQHQHTGNNPSLAYNYIQNRRAKVYFLQKKFMGRKMKTGVVQGGVLSPALFNYYLADFPTPPPNIKLIKYADDITIYTSGPVVADLINCLNIYLSQVLHHHMSLTCCIKSHCTPATLAPAHAPCLFSIDLHTVRQHLVIVHFLLLLLLSGTLFQMMSGVPHHCHHLSLV